MNALRQSQSLQRYLESPLPTTTTPALSPHLLASRATHSDIHRLFPSPFGDYQYLTNSPDYWSRTRRVWQPSLASRKTASVERAQDVWKAAWKKENCIHLSLDSSSLPRVLDLRQQGRVRDVYQGYQAHHYPSSALV